MQFGWSDEQRELREAAVDFARRTLVDGVADRDRSGTFSRSHWDLCASFGLHGLVVPERWGGAGHDLVTAVGILEAIGAGGRDNGLVFSISAHAASCAVPLTEFGTDEQRDAWLPELAAGRAIGATGITEPDTGSNVFGLRTTAVADGDDYVLNGSKTFVTNAPVADVFLLYARTSAAGFAGITCFLVHRDTPGLAVGAPIAKMGLRTSPMAEVFLEDCRVPASSVVGTVGSGAIVFNQTMEHERLMVMAPTLGVMEHLLERSVDHARRRTAGDTPIGKFQAVSHRIADMEIRLEQARLMLYRGAWMVATEGKAMRETALAKVSVSEAYEACCRSAIQVFGGYGYMVEYELERELRDATSASLYVGTSEIQRNLIAGLRGL